MTFTLDIPRFRNHKLLHHHYSLLCLPHWGVDILFLLFPQFGIRDAWFLVISRKSIYSIFTKFDMGVYWVNSLHGIALVKIAL